MTLHPISGKSYLLLFALLLVSAFSPAQTAVPVVLAPVPQLQFFDASGRPLAFGCVSTFQSQTTTPLATFTDFTSQVQNQNPVLLNAGGSANIWLQSGQAYSLVVKSSGGTNCALGQTLYTVDGVGGGASQLNTVVTPSGGSAAFTVQSQNQLFTLTLTANTAGQPVTFVGATAPALITFQITEDGAGAHTFSWPSNVIGAAPIDTTALHTTSQAFIWNGSSIMPVGSGFNSQGNTLIGNAVSCTVNGFIYVHSLGCYTSIQAAVSALPGPGNTIVLPPGVLTVSSSISIPANTYIVGAGAGRAQGVGPTVVRWTGGASPVFICNQSHVTFSGFTLDNTGTGTIGIQVNQAFFIALDDVNIWPQVPFSVAGYQAPPPAGGVSAYLTFKRVSIQQAGPINVDIDKANLVVFYDQSIVSHATGATPINIRVGNTATVNGFYFQDGSDNEFAAGDSHPGIGIEFITVNNAVVKSDFFEGQGTGDLAIQAFSGASNLDIQGNYFTGNAASNYAIEFVGTGGFYHLSSNVFTNFITAGIDNTIGTSNNIKLESNTVPSLTPTVINGLSGVTFYLDTSGRLNGITFGKGIGADGSGFKHKRFGATCSTGATTGNTCTTTYSWTTAFADASYTPVCTPVGPTQLGILSINSFNAAGVTILIDTATNASASYSGVDCIAVHD